MLINLHNLLHLPVFTESEIKLGKVHDLNLDIESHCVNSYIVRASLISKTYLIKPSQIVSVGKEKIIVEDAVIKEEKEVKEKKTKPTVMAEVAMSEEE